MKTEKRKRLKGSVLFTVVSVMSIMIIFMTATLAVAAAANRRARKTYSSAQSSYTARTAIDSILAAVGTDKEFSKAVRSLKLNEEMDIIVNVNNPSMGRVENAKIKFVGTKTVFDPDETVNTWVTRNLYNITADVTIGGETTRISTNILQDPPQGEGGGGGAAFLTWGGAKIDNHTYAWGGTYVGMGQWGDKTWNNNLDYITWRNEQQKLVVLENKEYLTHENYHFQNDMAIEAPMVINGNIDAQNTVSVYYTYNGYGIDNPGIQVWGNFDVGNNKVQAKFTKELRDVLTTDMDFMQVPYMYVDGILSAPNNFTIGEKGIPYNIFCGNFFMKSNDMNLYADMYCMDEDNVTVFSGSNSKLYQWTDSVATGGTGYPSVGGNFYSKGSVIVKSNLNIAGNMIVEGDLSIYGSLTVGGSLVVGGKLYGNPSVSKEKLYYEDRELKAGYEAKSVGTIFNGEVKSIVGDGSKYVLAKNVKWYGAGNKDHVPQEDFVYAIIDKEGITDVLDEDGIVTKPAPLTGRFKKTSDPTYGTVYDFGGKFINDNPYVNANPVSDYLVLGYHNYDVKDHDYEKCDDVYYTKAGTEEVVPTKKATTSKIKEGINSTETFKGMTEVSHGELYPNRAERETLIGQYWPVKGIEHRVISSDDVDPAILKRLTDPTAKNAYEVYTKMSPDITNITKSCTLEGEFNSPVIVNNGSEDIYIRLHNVKFMSPETEDNGIKKSTNTAYIDVEISPAYPGKVYFILDGTIKSNYYYKDEKSSSKLIKTVYDWQKEFNLEAIGNEPGTRTGTVYDSAKNVPTSGKVNGKDRIVINSDATLKGSWDATSCAGYDHDIIIEAPATGEIWITLDEFTMTNGYRLIVDDTAGGEVYFYVKNSASFDGGGIISKTLNDIFETPNKKVNIVSRRSDPVINEAVKNNGYGDPLEPLKIRMYAAKDTKLKFYNGAIITAYITAIYMDVDMPTVLENGKVANSIVYDGQPLDTADPQKNRFGVIGMLNCRSADAQNDWTLIYVSDDDSKRKNTVVDAEGAHAYEAVEYMAYAR